MEILSTVASAKAQSRAWREEGLSVGLVPTMGYLHGGHASLIQRSLTQCDRTVVSIFVNPTQFAPGEDLATYPRDVLGDTELCRDLGVAAIFYPEDPEMYPPGFQAQVAVPGLSQYLCGRSRPTHFAGVCLVVLKLLNIVAPHRAYFGLKDAQQFFILSRLARDLNLDAELTACPIVREPDGLALSSRNARLSPPERAAAPVLRRALDQARILLEGGERESRHIASKALAIIQAEPLARLDYFEIADAESLAPVDLVEREVLVAVAAFFGGTRLIDNFIFPPRL
ncbi:MAG: pantoate--beta-alanine ligase [Deltaproteobacteria bacterium]|jgi:pantoate--beta-alanine ligase|nr:pantoate--beta-alanine ligase [Deltaproteobacteria bacterium]